MTAAPASASAAAPVPAPASMRASCAPVIGEAVENDPRVVTLGADGQALFTSVLRRRPDRYVEVGIAEANLVGVAAGLARSGRLPVVGAMAPFLVRRAYEQIRLDICLPGLPVVLLGVGGGLGYGHLGPTHHAPDDIALMSALPNMRIYCPSDAQDAADVLRGVLPPAGPCYIRLAARPDPVVPAPHGAADTAAPVPRDPDGVRLLRTGADALVVATGRCVAEALTAAEALADDGVQTAVAAVSCLRPFPATELRALAAGRPLVVSVCEALETGALAQQTEAALTDRPGRLVRLEVDHRYPPVASHEELLRFYGVDSAGIRSAVLHHHSNKGS